MPTYFFDSALLASGWARDVRVSVDDDGDISQIESDARDDRNGSVHIPGVALPGMPNLHSHAFQRALAGLAEFRSRPGDSFWSWRRIMYDFVERLTPEQLEAVAAQLYLEMLKSGYTSVAEFHYLHRDPEGRPYAEIGRMSQSVIEAASVTGIGLTHLPVLYLSSGFGRAQVEAGQRRFASDGLEDYLALVASLQPLARANPQLTIGLAPHSLRAVPGAVLLELDRALPELECEGPVHIHIAEQLREVEDCLAHTGLRPVNWLLEHLAVDRRWCLVHATHLTPAETARLAASGAVAGLCPTTEANLGDGLFPLSDYLAADGCLGVGSDSNSSVSPVEELRWLEYGQRLVQRERNISADPVLPHVGRKLWQSACDGGARALGRRAGAIAPGRRADLVVLDPEHPALIGRTGDTLLDSFVFSGNTNPVRDVICGGQRVIEQGRHSREVEIGRGFRRAIRETMV